MRPRGAVGPVFPLAGVRDDGRGAELRPLAAVDARELTALVRRNLDHLRPWMPWANAAGGAAPTDQRRVIAAARQQEAAGEGLSRGIFLGDALVGVIGFHTVVWAHRSTSMGYWLDADAEGRGLMTASVRTLCDHAFGTWRLHRVEIRAAVGNARSRAIPERLGFVQEGVLRDAELVGERFLTLAVYAMLSGDWPT